jgi:hypothetical protein
VAHGHWVNWHDDYSDPSSSLSRRLVAIQHRLREALDETPRVGRIKLASMCAGQGRDVIGVLADHPRRGNVEALLVELDPHLVADARRAADSAGLNNVSVVEGDASTTPVYSAMVPADVVLICGVFGNVANDDVLTTIQELPRLCAPNATVIWTRHRRSPDLTPTIRGWFGEAGFEEIAFDTEDGKAFGVGTHRFTGPPVEFRKDRRMFTFIGDGADAHH